MTTNRQLLLIANAPELYGIDIAAVQEIRVYKTLTRLPHAPAHVVGILNVTGQILPVVDLRQLLWGQRTAIGPWHVIVLVKQDDMQCGILVDAANEIAEFADDQIDEMAVKSKAGCFAGIARMPGEDGVDSPVAILDIAAIASFSLEPISPDSGHREMTYV